MDESPMRLGSLNRYNGEIVKPIEELAEVVKTIAPIKILMITLPILGSDDDVNALFVCENRRNFLV